LLPPATSAIPNSAAKLTVIFVSSFSAACTA
jgi:hypothetical protein